MKPWELTDEEIFAACYKGNIGFIGTEAQKKLILWITREMVEVEGKGLIPKFDEGDWEELIKWAERKENDGTTGAEIPR